MFGYIKRKLEKIKQKKTFQEYGYEIKTFVIDEIGTIDYAQWKHPFEGPKEISKSKIDFYRKFSEKDGFIIDIGAHTGDTTVPMALAVGHNGLVLGIEPNRYVYKILAKNAQLNPKLTHIVPLPFAATAEDGEFNFNYSDASFCNGGFLSEIQNQHHGHVYTLPVIGKNLQSYLYENYFADLKRLQLLKIDAEGYDKEILKTFHRLLKEYKPYILAECYKRLTQPEREELYDVIADYGYTLYYLENFETDGEKSKIDRSDMMAHKHFEILAIPINPFK